MMMEIIDNKYKQVREKINLSDKYHAAVVAAYMFYTYQEFDELRTSHYI